MLFYNANIFIDFIFIGRKKVSTSMLDEEFEYVQQATNAYLDQEPFISSSVDGWENQASDSVKMVNVIDSKCHSFFWVLLTIRVRLAMLRATRLPWSLGSSAATMLELALIIPL